MLESKRKTLVGGRVPSVQRSVLFSSVGEVVEWFDFISVLVAALGFVILAASFMGPAMTAAMEHFSTDVRFSGFALGYDAGAGLFGGVTPLVASWLIHSTGSLTAPSYYLMTASAILLVVCFRLKETLEVVLK